MKWPLITGDVGGAGADSHTCKLGTFFPMPLTLSAPIFIKKSHQALLQKYIL